MSAPNLKEIEWAISELENQESSESRYTLLAALYTCKNQMLGLPFSQAQISTYSEEASPTMETLDQYGDSDFLRAVSGKPPAKVWPIIDDLMDALRVVNRRAYDNVMRKLNNVLCY